MIDSALLAALITGGVAIISAIIGFISHLNIFKCCKSKNEDENDHQIIELNVTCYEQEDDQAK
jgi:translation initiation factor IF-2